MNRRGLLVGGAAALLTGCVTPPGDGSHRGLGFDDLQDRLGLGGRLGIAAANRGTNDWVGFNADQRFAFCSTFKLVLAALILKEVESGRLALSTLIPFSQADIVFHAPVTGKHLAEGKLTLERLTRAIVEVSDNTAANVLMKQVGGPEGLTAFMRSIGDETSRLDRWETSLNSNLTGDLRDTTTPRAMLSTSEKLLLGPLLHADSRKRLNDWLVAATPGLNRCRAGLPQGWRAGDKTGTGPNGANNDVAIAWPPGRKPIMIASFISNGTADGETRASVHAEVARRIAGRWS